MRGSAQLLTAAITATLYITSVKAASIKRDLILPEQTNLTTLPRCDIGSENIPEFPVIGETNLFWTICVAIPVTPLSSRTVATILDELIYNIRRYLPPDGSLNRYRYRHSRNKDVEVGIGPSQIGTGPHQRTDPGWVIPNRLARTIMSQLRDYVRMQFSDQIYALHIFVYEKNTPAKRSRGTVAGANVELRPRIPVGDDELGPLGNVTATLK
ncbi:uncharacterized protein KY384_003546 [Bacidia gigantensis]|uniref:uncharacterized protein n=1 Tax=Bacidia gigantensis TaxID=2732470 RepID=UPI001D05AB41|nr:uncharacterized protein KY384_003546 [Bacidia gigantensis]KAG8531910.1 hypothetical protein KY384_003546 [Bacidia gigantensis]